MQTIRLQLYPARIINPMPNILLLHNGNAKAKEWGYSLYPDHQIMPCYTVDWPEDKVNFIAQQNNIICDITSADSINYTELCLLKKDFFIIKILTLYQHDLDNLEDVWDKNIYSYEQWRSASMCRLSVADQIMFYNNLPFTLNSNQQGEMIFSPGRCGSHVLQEIINVKDIYHHDQSLTTEGFDILVNSNKLFSILRKNFFKTVISRFGITTLGQVMLSNKNNIEQNKNVVKQCTPVNIGEETFIAEFNTIATFLDQLLGFKILWNKDISLFYLEELSPHFNKLKILKNPYEASDIISNYEQALEFGEKYQKLYNLLLKIANLNIKA